jgi:hypothetical protein
MLTFNKSYSNKFLKTRKKVEEGNRILVEFNQLIWDDGYLDKGMRAYIVSYGNTDVYDMEDGFSDNVTEITFDFEEFKEYNRKLEKKYKYSNGDYGTASELDLVPSNCLESSYFSEAYEEPKFRIVLDKQNSLYKRFLAVNSKLTYIEWLELQVLKSR